MKYDFDKVVDRRNTNSIKWDANEARFGEKDLLPLWVADMDFEVAEPIVNAIQERVSHKIYGYNMAADSTYDAVAHWLKKRHGWEVEKESMKFSPGVVPALSTLVRALTAPGDKVMIQTPVYYPFFKMVENNDRELVQNELVYREEEKRYYIDFEDFEQKAKDPALKMVILSNPHNPVGRAWNKEELEKMGRICVDHDVIIISDDIHFDLMLNGNQYIPIASLSEEFKQQTVTCIAPSKTFNLAGMQTSVILLPNKEHREAFAAEIETQGIGMLNSFGAAAMEAAYNHGDEWLDQLISYLEDNLEFLKGFISEKLPKVDVIEPEGMYLVWMDFRKYGLDYKELESVMLKEAKIALNQGHIFGEGGRGFLRINIACPRSTLNEGLERIVSGMETVTE